jgi:hypothetical protein
MSKWVTVELESTESIQLVEVKLVACIIRELTLTNSTIDLILKHTPYSHPGYFGKRGMRHFHLKRNQYFTPTINLDKVWSLVSE